VCGILLLLLFFGVSITSCTSGNIREISNQLHTNFNMNNNYVNAYWKFDDCSGTTLSDSSGHNNVGTIIGPIWTIEGYSNCSLDFDGINDYVNLDAHSENLGFNKTDDLIFSAFFNSTSTQEGHIYCMSDSVLMQNMEFSVGFNSNGNIIVYLWDFSCGITLTSTDVYNDRLWHNVKIFYHGSTAKSIVEIYVDNNFDTGIEKSICSFYDYEFKRAKIGRRAAESTKYFNGLIDETKIIKYPGGNEEPNKPVIEGPMSGEIGETLSYLFVTTDNEEDDIFYMIDWGDGYITNWIGPEESGDVINRSHVYSENGSYEINAKAKDFWNEGAWSNPFLVEIGNLAPTTPDINGPTIGTPGEEYNYSFVSNDPEGDEVWYDIKWGDGDSITDKGPYPSGTEQIESHTWNEKGDFMIEVRARDTYGGYSDWGQFEVKMPRNIDFNLNLFWEVIGRFPLLEWILTILIK
jgi:hypothetical protein